MEEQVLKFLVDDLLVDLCFEVSGHARGLHCDEKWMLMCGITGVHVDPPAGQDGGDAAG